jgi:hypothetical protein
LIVVLVPVVLADRWKAGLRLVMASAVIYLAAVLVVSDGMPWTVLTNIRMFVGDGAFNYWEKIYFSTSFEPWLRTLNSDLALDAYLDGWQIEALRLWMGRAMILVKLALGLGLVAACLTPVSARSRGLIAALVMAFLMGQTEALGGYSMMLLVALVFCQSRPSSLIVAALLCCYVLSIPGDCIVIKLRESEAGVWLSGREVEVISGVAVGQVLRPLLVLVIETLLAANLIQQAWLHRTQVAIRTVA